MSRKRRVIEIYFVLYLAALIFLIPGKDSKDIEIDNASNVFNLPYTIKPEKTTLICRMALDSNGTSILSIDSVNTIYFTGNAEKVKYEFIVESRPLGQKLHLATDEKSRTKLFRMKENSSEQSATFIWQPPSNIRSSTTYLVNVIANVLQEGSSQYIQVKTQFSLIIYFYERQNDIQMAANGRYTPIDSHMAAGQMRYMQNIPTGDVLLEPGKDRVRGIAYEKWENTIFVMGLNPMTDLLKNPKIEVIRSHSNNGGTAEIKNIFNNSVTLGGITPGFGSMKVSINLVRSYDNQEAEVTFQVVPQAIEKPEFARVMHPGRQYVIKPNLPLSNSETKAILRSENRIRAVSKQGEDFSFTPSLTDIGKILHLELYIDGNLYGQTYEIIVEDYPNPAIINIVSKGNNTLKLQTRSHGIYKDEKNYIKDLNINGNARYFELSGDAYYNSNDNYYIQFFEIAPKDPSKPFKFSVQAEDLRGRKSEEISYP